jgi:hypothetical protein
MATRQDVLKIIDLLTKNYQNFHPKSAEAMKGMTEIWIDELAICIPEYLEIGAHNIIRTSKFFPSVADMLQAHEMAMLDAIEARVGKGNANRILQEKNEP